MFKTVEIYTDGACSGNPGNGGWATILIYNGKEKILSGGEKDTTNNKMELTAIVKGLEALKEKCNVNLYSDSQYSLSAFTEGWIDSWLLNGFKTANNKPVKNSELFIKIYDLTKVHNVNFIKVKGHADNVNNNRCDKIARDEISKLTK